VRSQTIHHRMVVDLIFADAGQWSSFQSLRRRNPGVFLGTIWFLRVALFQTYRGLYYFVRNRSDRTDAARAASGARA
jgi:cellulose synthase (UDP-forming)